jgi:hypothetical protein
MSDLGFGKAKHERIDLSSFKLGTAPRPVAQDEDAIADRAAKDHGFTSREPTERVVRKRKPTEPQDSIYIRGPLSLINEFKTYCDENELTYGDAIAVLMKAARD